MTVVTNLLPRALIVCMTLLVALPCISQIRFQNDTVYKFSNTILKASEQNGSVDYSKAAQDFSFISDYRNMMMCDSKVRKQFGKINRTDSSYFLDFKVVDAKDYIVEKAKSEQIIIINEAHHIPYHRVFIASLLKDLYQAGFRYYGAETLNYLDSTINERKYPIINSGYYTVEPQFGNLVRDALSMGYTIFGYEARSVESFSSPKQREIEQALNIQKVLLKDPKAKILLHAGYDHIREDSMKGGWEKAMAARLKDLTGINPFTIDQEVLTERAERALENPYYLMIDVRRPSVLIDKNGDAFRGPKGTHLYDVRMAHPRTNLVRGRPDWLLANGAKFIDVPQHKVGGFPCLIQAYKIGENIDEAVPVDVFEISGPDDFKPLALRPGKYMVLVKRFDLHVSKFELSVK
jgi:hypothetical protein